MATASYHLHDNENTERRACKPKHKSPDLIIMWYFVQETLRKIHKECRAHNQEIQKRNTGIIQFIGSEGHKNKDIDALRHADKGKYLRDGELQFVHDAMLLVFQLDA